MRKSLILTILILFFSAGIFYIAQQLVDQGKEAIAVEETVLYGDPTFAEGVTFTNRVHCDNHLFWNTVYAVNEVSMAETQYDFSQTARYGNNTSEANMDVYIALNFSMGGGDIDLEQSGEEGMPMKAVIDVAGRTPAGGTHKEEVRLKDYYSVYPISADLYIPGKSFDMDLDNESVSDYFGIPVLSEHKLEVTVTKSKRGKITSVDSSSITGEPSIFTSSVVTDAGGYCVMTVYKEDGESMELPEGVSGIHFLPFALKDGGIQPLVNEMRLVYSIDDQTARVLELMESPDQSRLFLITEEHDSMFLSVLNIKTMSLMQKIKLADDAGEEGLWGVESYESFLLPILSDGRFSLLVSKPDGTFSIQMAGNFFEHIDVLRNLPSGNMALDYDGNRLAAAIRQEPSDCSTYLMVYNKNGLAYAGQYDHSGDHILTEDYHDKVLYPVNEESLFVTCR